MDDHQSATAGAAPNLGLPAPVLVTRAKPRAKLFSACCKGTHLPEVVIELR